MEMLKTDALKSPQAALAERNAELTVKHDEIWDLMGLSRPVKDELNAVVLTVNTQMAENRSRNPEVYDKVFKQSKRKETISRAEYISDHKKRWQMLGLSVAAQEELLSAAEFCWTALHDPSAKLTAEELGKAEIIRTMMKELGGPPPCCDENIFEKAKA
jgi:hypothetical protein